jgi:hypothetical protein
MNAVHQNVEHRRIQEGIDGQHFAGCRGSCDSEDPRADNSSDPERSQAYGPERFSEAVFRLVSGRNQCINRLST